MQTIDLFSDVIDTTRKESTASFNLDSIQFNVKKVRLMIPEWQIITFLLRPRNYGQI